MTETIKKKMGRPTISPIEKKRKQVNLHMSEVDYLRLKNEATKANLSIPKYTKKAILNSKVEILGEDFIEEIKYFNKTFSNVNRLIIGLQANQIDVQRAADLFKLLVETYKRQASNFRGKAS